MTVVYYLRHFDLVWSFFRRKLEISSGRFARFADGSAVVQVHKICQHFNVICKASTACKDPS